MAGPNLASQLTRSRVRAPVFDWADAADDGELRRLLRQTPLGGSTRLCFEREPDYFLEDRFLDQSRRTLVARQEGHIICAGSCAIRQRFINGRAEPVGYLGGLRLDPRFAGRFEILRSGYRFFAEAPEINQARCFFTSIATENERALRFLERGLPGMPVYEAVSELVTLLIAVPRREPTSVPAEIPEPREIDALVNLLNTQAAGYQFAPRWSAEELLGLSRAGLRLQDFRVLRDRSGVRAAAALWDQRSFKQTVIRAYPRSLNCAGPLLNLAARITGTPVLPEIGVALPQAFISPLTSGIDVESLSILITSLFGVAQAKGVAWLTLVLALDDPRVEAVRKRFSVREYRTRLYRVRWPDNAAEIATLDNRTSFPDGAFL